VSAYDQLFGLEQPAGLGQNELQDQGLPSGISPEFQDQDMVQKNLGEVQAFGLFQKATNEDGQIEPASWSIDSAGRVKGDMPAKDFFQLLGGFRQNQQTQAAFNAEALRLKAQEDKIRANPLLSVLSAVAAGAAQDPRMPAIVRALGYANASLNPSPDALAQRRMGLLQTMAQLEQEQAGHANAAGTLQRQLAKDTFEENLKMQEFALKKAAMDKAETKQDEASIDKFLSPYTKDARDDKIPRLAPHDEFVRDAIKKAGMDLPDAEDAYKNLQSLYQATLAGREEASKQRVAEGVAIEKAKAPIRIDVGTQLAQAKGNVAVDTFKKETPLVVQRTQDVGKIKNDLAVSLKEEMLNRGIPEKQAEAQTKGRGAGQLASALLKEKGILSPQEHKIMDESFSTDQLLDRTERMMADPIFKDISGPIFSIDPKTKSVSVNTQAILPSWLKGAERTQYESQLAHELPRILNVINPNGATSLLRSPEGWKRIEALGAAKNQRPDQIAAILDVIRGANNDRRAPIVSRKAIDWTAPENALLLGLNNPKNSDYFLKGKDWKGPMSVGPIIRGGGGAAATGGVLSPEEWLRQKKGQ